MSSEQPLGIKLQATDYRLKQSCNIPRFYQILEWNFCFCFVVMIEISQGFKTFWVYLKVLLENHFKLLFISWRTPLRKQNIKILFSFFYSNLCKLACKGMVYKNVILVKGCFLKLWLGIIFKVLFYKSIISYFKDLFLKTLILFYVMQAKTIGSIKNFLGNLVLFLKTSFLTGLKHCVDF
jgi:hypothetical protein